MGYNEPIQIDGWVPGSVRGHSSSLASWCEDKGMENRRIQAFSRVEMVVVGVCAAMVLFVTLPSLTGAREAGKRAICLANLKTLGAGTLCYAQDYEDKIPGWGIEFDEIKVEQGDPKADWITKTTDSLAKSFEYGYIWEYIQSKKPFTCPSLNNTMNPKSRIASNPHSGYVWGWPGGAGTVNPPGPMWSYCVNATAGMSLNDIQWRANPELVLPGASTVFMLYEADFNDYAAYDNSVCLFAATHQEYSGCDSLGSYHMTSGTFDDNGVKRMKGSGNLVCFDGHIGSMTSDEYRQQRSTSEGTLELCGGYINFTWPGF